jgi:abequosyltransferase
MNAKLSICIPTYNRAKYLKELFESFLVQERLDQVEIIVSDNCSTDDTAELVNSYKDKFPSLTYHVNSKNVGPERNFLISNEYGTADYVWLFGSDDALSVGSLSQILDALKDRPDIILSDRMNCDIQLNPKKTNHWLSCPGKLFDTTRKEDLVEFLEHAQSVGAIFSFITSNIYKRSLFNGYDPAPFFGTQYVHVPPLLLNVVNGGKLLYVDKPLILCRGGNDSFHHGSYLDRILLDWKGYGKLLSVLKLESIPENGIKKILLRENHMKWILSCIAKDKGKNRKGFIFEYDKLKNDPLSKMLIQMGFLFWPILYFLDRVRRLLLNKK